MAKPCPTCTAIFTGSHAHCPTCRGVLRKASRQRNGRTDSVYSTSAWRRQRADFLHRHPRCVDCGGPATEPDHAPPRRILLALEIANPDHFRWLQARCHDCHSAVTMAIDQPLLRRLAAGEAPEVLAQEALELRMSRALR